jgi:hypothetical protein
MGLKTIETKWKLADQEYENTFGAFVKSATRMNALLAQLQKRQAEIDKLNEQLAKDVHEAYSLCQDLNAYKNKQLLDVKALLEARFHTRQFAPISASEIANLEADMKAHTHHDVQKMMDAYTEKLAASWPKEIKPGMVFKKKNMIVEVVVFFETGWNVKAMIDGKDTGRRHLMPKELTPSNGWKYLRG